MTDGDAPCAKGSCLARRAGERADMPRMTSIRLSLCLSLILFTFGLPGCTNFDSADSSGPGAIGTDAPLVTYRCESGQTVEASYPSTSSAVVRYGGRTRVMSITLSASGARYAGDELEWWTKGTGPGSKGTLFRHEPDGTTGETVERCAEAARTR